MKLKVLHIKGTNPNVLAPTQMGIVNNLTQTYIFTEESKYETKDPKDQEDWNKLTGITSSLFNSKKASHMWAWRYYNNEFQVAPYSHKPNGDKILPTPDRIITVPMNTKIDFHIVPVNTFEVAFYLYMPEKFSTMFLYPNYLSRNKNLRLITSWFGGTSTPKSNVKIYG